MVNRNIAEPGQLRKVYHEHYPLAIVCIGHLLVSINKCDLYSLHTAGLIQGQWVQERGRDFENLLY